MNAFSHLAPEVAAVMQRTVSERISYAKKDCWIGYPRAQKIINILEDLLDHPRTLRMPNLLLVGDSGNGKSTIVDHFWKKHEAFVEEEGNPILPIVMVEMPPRPTESRFWSAVLEGLMVAHNSNAHVQIKEAQASTILRKCKTRILIIDEIHNLLFGHAREQREFLGMLKNMSNRLCLSIVAVGTRDAIRALHTDPQLSSRFEPFGLQRWQINREFVSLLASFERLMPLAEPSFLASKEIAMKIHSLSGGTIGGIAGVIKKATAHAIKTGQERIDINCLNSIDWIRLDDYGKSAELL